MRRARGGSSPGITPYLYVAPALLLYVVFSILPFIHSIWLSLFQWDGLNPGKWVGLANYERIVSDPLVRSTFLHPLVLLVFYSLIPILLGLALTVALSRNRIRGLTAFRTILFLPQVAASVLIAVAWQQMFVDDGPINTVLRAIGLGGLSRTWLGDFNFALPSIGVVGSWVGFGFTMILFLSGAQKIPQSLYDAARIDGAGIVREFFAVTLPALRRELVVALVITTSSSLTAFDLVFLLTSGGPGNSTNVPGYAVYQTGFVLGQVGAAAAYGVALTVIVMVVVGLIMRLDKERV
jgi:raffinose/stachyose/melibiose transport system permease protein